MLHLFIIYANTWHITFNICGMFYIFVHLLFNKKRKLLGYLYEKRTVLYTYYSQITYLVVGLRSKAMIKQTETHTIYISLQLQQKIVFA